MWSEIARVRAAPGRVQARYLHLPAPDGSLGAAGAECSFSASCPHWPLSRYLPHPRQRRDIYHRPIQHNHQSESPSLWACLRASTGTGTEYLLVLCSAPSVPQPVFTITEKAPTRAFSWLKAATSAFTFKTLLRHYAKQALTHRGEWVTFGWLWGFQHSTTLKWHSYSRIWSSRV